MTILNYCNLICNYLKINNLIPNITTFFILFFPDFQLFEKVGNLSNITGDKPPQPFLCLDQERIFKRMLAKGILRFAFKKLAVEVKNNSVHGEFGNIESYNQTNLQNLIDTDLQNTNSL